MLDEILHLLNTSSIVHSPQVVELIVYGQNAFRVKLRANLTEALTLQIWLNHNDQRTRYAYQLLQHGQPILRWDNAPHHPEQATNFPNHCHDELGQLTTSPLSGHPATDLPIVLLDIEKYAQKTRKAS